MDIESEESEDSSAERVPMTYLNSRLWVRFTTTLQYRVYYRNGGSKNAVN